MTKENKTLLFYNVAKRVAVISASFAVILCVLLIVNYIQIKSADPLNSKVINQLMEQLREDQNNEVLKEQIRTLDLLARKAYFTNQWQIRTGGFLLFIFVITLLIAVKYISSLRKYLPDLTEEHDSGKMWENRLISGKYTIYCGLSLLIFAFISGVLTDTELSGFGTKDGEPANDESDFPTLEEVRSNWPNFRGPDGIGIAHNAGEVPVKWDGKSGENIFWKTEIPVKGYNSPIIWGNRLFLSGADRKTLVVFCLDAESGAILWQKELNDIPGTPVKKPDTTDDTGLAAPTMATDGIRVFVLFGTGDVACLDFEGNRLWAKNLGVPDNHYGHSSSLITYRDLLLIQYDQNSGGRIIALKTESGNTVYDKIRETGISWSSPIVVNTGNRYEFILNSLPNVISYDPGTGRELWRVNCMMGEVAPSPAYADGIVFAVNEYARLVAIQPADLAEPIDSAVVLWDTDEDLAEVSSPLAVKDYIFVAASYGTVSCFDSKTGERYWFQDFENGFYSSPVLAGENILLMDMKGTVFIFKADKEFNLINKCELGETAVTTPAVINNRIYIRGLKNLYCIGK